jgi:hypothetical protein
MALMNLLGSQEERQESRKYLNISWIPAFLPGFLRKILASVSYLGAGRAVS